MHAAFALLPAADRELLAYEMALSGVAGEPYALTPAAKEGPAFLVYYSPAFVRLAAHDEVTALAALKMLAEVYRTARQLWKPSADAAGRTCTVHIGEIKALKISDIVSEHAHGGCWLMERRSDAEAVVTKVDLSAFGCSTHAEKIASGQAVVMRFWPALYRELEVAEQQVLKPLRGKTTS